MKRKHGKNKQYFGEFKESYIKNYEIKTQAENIKYSLKL